MSAFISVLHADRVELVTDGAVYFDDGTLTGIEQKVWASTKHPLAVTTRGCWELGRRLGEAAAGIADQAASVDDALVSIAALLVGIRDGQEADPASARHVEILVAALSETRGAAHFYGVTHGHHAGLAPYCLREVARRDFAAGPTLDETDLSGLGIDAAAATAAGNGFLRRFGAELMEAMRRKPGKVNFAEQEAAEGYGIGGHCQLTTITAQGVAIETLRRWPDKLGELIDPFAAAEAEEAA